MTWGPKRATVFFPLALLVDIRAEAKRLDRSMDWVLRQAWRISRGKIAKSPTVDEPVGDERRSTL